MKEEMMVYGKPLSYWKQNAKEDYGSTPISVLKYITVLEVHADQSAKRKDELIEKMAESANQFRGILNDIESLVDTGANQSDLKNLWNNLSDAISAYASHLEAKKEGTKE